MDNQQPVTKSLGKGIFLPVLPQPYGVFRERCCSMCHKSGHSGTVVYRRADVGAGVILLVVSLIMYRGQTFEIFKHPKDLLRLVAYAAFGLAANLYTFTSVLNRAMPLQQPSCSTSRHCSSCCGPQLRITNDRCVATSSHLRWR